MDRNVKISMLLDLYGNILSKIQFDSLDLYYNQDLSLSEIAQRMGKTRQGVYDAIKRSELILDKMESSLGFFDKINKINEQSKKVLQLIRGIESDCFANIDLNTKNKIELAKEITESLIYQTSP